MNNENLSNKITICCTIFLWTLGANAVASGQTKSEAPKAEIPEIVKFQRRVRAAVKERRAEEAYEKRNAEITPWVEDTAPPNQDNAALLYYQAFLLQPALDLSTSHKIDDVLRGAQADRQVRTYLGHCLPAIEMAEIASRIPQCSWGVRYLQIPGYNKLFLSPRLYHLVIVLLADARTLAADGH